MNPTETNIGVLKNKKVIIVGLVILVIAVVAALFAVFGKKDEGDHPPVVTDITASAISAGTTATSTAASASSTEPLRQILGNISYGLKQPQTKLVNGYFVGKFEDCGGRSCNGITYYSHMKLGDIMAVGDLNGDGEKDAAVIVGSVTTQSSEHEGLKYTTQVIAAMVKQGDTYKNVAAVELSDDISAKTTTIEKLTIKDGVIYATVARNLGSMNLSYPTATEEIQLKLNQASASGFSLFKNGVPANPIEFIPPTILKAEVSGSGNNKILVLSGKNLAMFKNAVVLTSKDGSGREYESIIVGSSKGNSAISIELSNVSFPALEGNVSSKPYDIRPMPSGTFDVSVKSEICAQNLPCQIVVSNAVEVKI